MQYYPLPVCNLCRFKVPVMRVLAITCVMFPPSPGPVPASVRRGRIVAMSAAAIANESALAPNGSPGEASKRNESAEGVTGRGVEMRPQMAQPKVSSLTIHSDGPLTGTTTPNEAAAEMSAVRKSGRKLPNPYNADLDASRCQGQSQYSDML